MPSDNPSQRNLRIGDYAKITIATVILAAGIFRGIFFDYTESFGLGFASLLILIPLLLVLGAVALLNKFICKPPFRKRIGGILEWLVVIVGSMTLSAILCAAAARGAMHWHFVVAQRYAANAVTLLNDVKVRTGSYPKTLPVDKLGPLPTNLTYGTYGTDGKIGGFLYFDEDGEGILTYDCGTKTWHREL